jgi:hypothetical protein
MILGESSSLLFGNWKERKCIGIYRRNGYATEFWSIISISAEDLFSKSMKMALKN